MPPTTVIKFGINNEKAILFYSNPETRRLYREHLEKLATRKKHDHRRGSIETIRQSSAGS